ncbi:MAG: aspartate aminotransferase family protein [Truepera sp.]|nr:aspartate aminotransferase family protein [Truepera sp.]
MAATALDRATLLAHDRALIHPLQHPAAHEDPLIIDSGEGVWIKAIDGRRYLDGLAGLWNVNIGYGRLELADAAHAQMAKLAYTNNYAGVSNPPAIELAHLLAGYAYHGLNTTFFTAGGAESNESAFKTARYYWKRLGKPEKYKVIAREEAYHGLTLAAMSATGISRFWPMFEPRVPGFLHAAAPNPYRFGGEFAAGESVGEAAARSVEEMILREGAETVAAVIAEPVQGSGGVIVPPEDYFPRLREICNRHEVLLIADEVITGFGRTGARFALDRWGVTPDILSFAKGVTSGYLPLGGIQISDAIREVIEGAEPAQAWLHGYTYSGHATSCAVALANLEIMEREGLPARSATMGERLRLGLEDLTTRFPEADNVRGLGLLCGIEFVKDRESREPDPELCARIQQGCRERGLLIRNIGATLAFSPPLVISSEEVDHLVGVVGESIEAAR